MMYAGFLGVQLSGGARLPEVWTPCPHRSEQHLVVTGAARDVVHEKVLQNAGCRQIPRASCGSLQICTRSLCHGQGASCLHHTMYSSSQLDRRVSDAKCNLQRTASCIFPYQSLSLRPPHASKRCNSVISTAAGHLLCKSFDGPPCQTMRAAKTVRLPRPRVRTAALLATYLVSMLTC